MSQPGKHAVLGTAGHIDHGKTELIKALTGVDTDRLKEEKERGISIELGFARLDLPSGASVGVVDVPGHERFVKTMLAGVGGIDLILVVVAADEGVMPQTREHLDIVDLLGVTHGVVALTKTDLVEPGQLELAREEVEELLEGTSLEGSPIVPVSSVAGDGLEDLLVRLDEKVQRVEERLSSGPARLPVDRIFTLAGHGTIVTGTLWSGRIRSGDRLEVFPRGIITRIRSVQVHDRAVEEAVAGQRTALGLRGVSKEEISRGDTLGPPGEFRVSTMFDARFRLVGGARPMSNRTRLHVHIGTAEVLGRVILLEGGSLSPGEDALVQMRLESPVVAETGDLFVVRSYSPAVTVGGGRIIDPSPRRHRRMRDDVLSSITTLEMGREDEVLAQVIADSGIAGTTEREIGRKIGPSYLGALGGLVSSGDVVRVADRLVSHSAMEELRERTGALLMGFVGSSPLEWGMPTEELRGKLDKRLDRGVLWAALKDLVAEGKLVRRGDLVRWGTAEVELTEEQSGFARAIESRFLAAGPNPPSLDTLREEMGGGDFDAIVKLLVSSGRLVKVTSALLFHPDVLGGIRESVLRHFETNRELTVPQFKSIIGATRKYAIPLIEHLDRTGVTMRAGDVRIKKQ